MRVCWAQWLMIALVVVFGTTHMLTACGNKGPLVLPEELQEPAETTTDDKPKKPVAKKAE